MSEDKVVVKAICINELSYPLPRPVTIGKIESRLYIWNTMMAMRSEWQKDYDELQKYKAIEEELGVDLITLFKAFMHGIWSKGGTYGTCYLDSNPTFIPPNKLEIGRDWYVQYDKDNDKYENEVREEDAICLYKHTYEIQEYSVRVKDYGKTWALTKEELL